MRFLRKDGKRIGVGCILALPFGMLDQTHVSRIFSDLDTSRIATDLNLHHVSSAKPKNEKEEREMLNRARVWMLCFNLDRSTATQFGKPSTIKED